MNSFSFGWIHLLFDGIYLDCFGQIMIRILKLFVPKTNSGWSRTFIDFQQFGHWLRSLQISEPKGFIQFCVVLKQILIKHSMLHRPIYLQAFV